MPKKNIFSIISGQKARVRTIVLCIIVLLIIAIVIAFVVLFLTTQNIDDLLLRLTLLR